MRRRDFLKIAAAGVASVTPLGQAALAFAKDRAGLVVILDDFGNGPGSVNAALKLEDVPYTAAVLPGQLYTEPAIEALTKTDADIILHQPMEPVSMKARGLERQLMAEPYEVGAFAPDIYRAICDENTKEQAMRVTAYNLADLDKIVRKYAPDSGIIGLNNHQGSLVTQDEELMDAVAAATKHMQHFLNRKLTVIDSRTIGNSVLKESAQAEGLKTGERDYWLDEADTGRPAYDTLERIGNKAARTGKKYILIGHAHYQDTVDALDRFSRKNPASLLKLSDYR